MASADPRAELTCSICVEIFKDPVTLPCGHSFCQGCITQTWDSQDEGESTCPECNQRYRRRPELKKSVRLVNLVEFFRPAEQPKDGNFCSHCIHVPVPAVKSCLHCEVSLCDEHLRFHAKSPEHVLSDPSASLGDRKCSAHSRILEYFCTQDSAYVCACCRLDGEHQGHPVQMLQVVSEKKKGKLRENLRKLSLKKREMGKRAQELQEGRNKAQEKMAGMTKKVASLFGDIRRQLEDLERRVMSEITGHNEVLHSISDLIRQLEVKKDELSGKIQRIEEICNVTDPLTVLHEGDEDGEEFCDIKESRDEGEEDLYAGDLDEGLISEMIHTGLSDLITGIKRGIYVQGPSEVLLDVATAARNVYISDDLKTVSLLCEKVNREESPDKSQDSGQVFSTKSFSSGRHYWEVETSELGECVFGVAYPSMDRESGLGSNSKSWCMCKWHLNSSNHYLVTHNNICTDIHQQVSCNRFSIYLDCEAGRLSFYELSIPIRHLHTFTVTFTEPLHAVFSVSNNGDLSSVWMRIRN